MFFLKLADFQDFDVDFLLRTKIKPSGHTHQIFRQDMGYFKKSINAIQNFNESFFCINPDTIWIPGYLNELKNMKKKFLASNKKCAILVVNKNKSFDKSLKGDFILNNDLINR